MYYPHTPYVQPSADQHGPYPLNHNDHYYYGATNGQLSPQGAALPTTPQQTRQSLTSPSPKRKRANDENLDSSLPVLKKSKYTARRSPEDKLEVVFKALQDVNWTLGDFLYHLFRQQDEKGNLVRRSQKHASYVHKLLSGRCGTSGKGVGFILNAWFQSGEEEDAEQLMYFTTSVPYQNIRSARPALTSFAAQLVKKKLVQEAEAAVQPRSGLHAMQQVSWADIHSTTVASVAGVIQKLQPLTWELVTEICARPPRKRGGVVVERQRRPVNGVTASIISQMDYSRNSHANKLAIIKGLFDFAHGVPFDVFACNSRVAYTVSYGAVRHCLEELSQQEARLVVERARDHTRGGVVVMDNVQNYLMQRDIRIGRTHTMNVGLAATYVELEGIHPNALNFADKMW